MPKYGLRIIIPHQPPAPAAKPSNSGGVSLQTTHGSKRTNHCLQQTNNRPTNFTNNTRTDIGLTKDGSKRTNHCVQSSQPMTTRLNWQSTNNITTSLTNHINDQSIYTTHWRYTNHLTLKMTSAQVVETSVNVTLNSPSQDYTHPDDCTPLSYVTNKSVLLQPVCRFLEYRVISLLSQCSKLWFVWSLSNKRRLGNCTYSCTAGNIINMRDGVTLVESGTNHG